MSEGSSTDRRDEPRDRVQLSLVQVAGSAAASVTAAVLCSYFGVAGTVIGTAAASALATIGSALYSYSLRRTQNRLRRLHQAGAASPPVTTVLRTAKEQGHRITGRINWRIVLLGTANVFVFSIAFITGLEGLLGRSLPAEFGVSHAGNNTTSLGSITGSSHHRKSSPSPSASPSPSKTGSSSPAPTSPTPTKSPSSRPQPTPVSSSPTPPTPTASTSGILPTGLPSSP